MNANTDKERAEIRGIVEAVLKRYTREMEGYSYFGSNPGVREDDYEEIAEEIEKAISARRAPSAAPVELPEPDGSIGDGCLVFWKDSGPEDGTDIYKADTVRALLASTLKEPTP